MAMKSALHVFLTFVFNYFFIKEINCAYLAQLFFSATYIVQGFAVKS